MYVFNLNILLEFLFLSWKGCDGLGPVKHRVDDTDTA